MDYRIEKDLLGEKQIPVDSYWGIHTARARENFPVSGRMVDFYLIKALVMVKKAAAQANHELGYLNKDKFVVIEQACDEVSQGKFNSSFVVDALCGGAGTSINMNVNEVLANRALEILSKSKGDYSFLHPIEDVNMHQSTNDVFPTGVRIAVINKLKDLSAAIAGLQGAFQQKEKAFAGIVTIGRSELQGAVPVSLGAQFGAFAQGFERDRWRTFKCEERLRVVNIGGTVIGTGLGAPRDYIFLVIEKLRALTGLGLSRGENLLDATSNQDALCEVAGIIKTHAQNIIKVANDLRLLQLLGDISLNAVQAGSSLVPGKVNPVIPEAIIQAAIVAASKCDIVADCVGRGSLQINEFMPLIAESLLGAIELLTNADKIFLPCVAAIVANSESCLKLVENSVGIITAFVHLIGYEKATALTIEFKGVKDKSVRTFLAEKLGKELVDKTLSAENIMSLGYKDVKRA
jgi:aspartate ammonia-lyase